MEEWSTSMNPCNKNLNPKDALSQARRLLSKVSTEGNEDQQSWQFDSPQTSEALGLCFSMACSFHNASFQGTEPPLTSKDCTVIRAIIELIVRWGISPYLSPGVGVRREKKSREKEAALAISKHLEGSNVGPVKSSSSEEDSSPGVLLLSCGLLASFVMDSQPQRGVAGGFCVSSLVRNYYWMDAMAGFLQVAYGPSPQEVPEEVLQKRRRIAISRIGQAVETLPVGEMVETFLGLLGQRDPYPPDWMKSEAGKVLSRLVMRDGGVQAVLQRLVGAGVKGDVQVYNNVAAHLGKVPKYVANAEEYYQTVCPQLLPFLLVQNSVRSQPGESKTAQQILRNMHHTSILLACTMIVREPVLSEIYLLKPILGSLVKWCKSQSQSAWSENLGNEDEGQEVTETLIVGSLMQLRALLTAGHKDIDAVRTLLLQKTQTFVPFLMMLHYLLETSAMSKPFWKDVIPAKRAVGFDKMKHSDKKVHNKNEEKAKNKVRQKDSASNEKGNSMGLTKGFLEGYVSEKSDEDEDQSTVGRLKATVMDLLIVHVMELPKDSIHIISGFLYDLDLKKFTWPTTEGNLWNALSPSSLRLHTPAEYLSRLLLASENWSLVVTLMADILWKIFKLRQSLKVNMMQPFSEETSGQTSLFSSVLQVLQSFETVNEIVGSKALEQDSLAASKLVKDLLDDPTVMSDAGMIELVLHMVDNVLNGFSLSFLEHGSDEQRTDVLNSMATSLERICSSDLLTEKVQTMSSTLNTRVSSLMAP